MKNKHYEMIVAKAANMDLVVFINHSNENEWKEMRHHGFPDFGGTHEYFLCLPHHKEVCLHWLKGGEVQFEFLPNGSGNYGEMEPLKYYPWCADHLFIDVEVKLRIKPKKVKRWIATFPWYGIDNYVTPEHFPTESALDEYIYNIYGTRVYQVIEIEVEIVE